MRLPCRGDTLFARLMRAQTALAGLTLLMFSGVIGLTAALARRFVRPMNELQGPMDARARGAAGLLTAADDSAPMGNASAEVRAMHQAHDALLARLKLQEQERLLLLAGISHDLRSALTRIRLSADLLPPGGDFAADVVIIHRNVDQADRLLGSFMDHVRAGALPLDEQVDLAAVAATVCARINPAAHALRLEALPGARVVLAHGNALLLDRLVSNLVDNAFKHGQGPVTVAVRGDGRLAQLTVTDQGSGLPTGQADLLRRAFARGDNSRGVAGTGLGLTVVQQVVQRLGGRLDFRRDSAGHHAEVSLPQR